MATLEGIADALRNAHAAGDTAAAQKLADAYVSMQGQSQSPQPVSDALKVSNPSQNWSNVGAENMDQAGIRPLLKDNERNQARAVTAIPFNLGDEAVAGARGAIDMARGKGFSGGYNEELGHARDVQKRYASENPVESIAAGLPGNIAASEMLPGGPLTKAAGTGFIQGFGGGEGGIVNRAGSGGIGAATGAATSVAANSIGQVLSQPKLNPDVELLRKEGVPLTPGQMGGKIAKKTEDIATSVPVMGDFIAKRQGESIEGLNRAVANRALDPIGQKLPANIPAGRATVAYVKKAMKDSYDTVLSGMQASPDMPFSSALQTVKATAATLPESELGQFNKIINSEIFDKVAKSNGVLDGDAIKGIESTLTAEIKGYSSGGWNEQKLAAALTNAKSAFRDMITRQNPSLAPKLAATDRAYADYAILRKAGSAVGNDGGVFTPAQLQNAVASADSSAGRGNFASGGARMQDLSDAAKNVLPSKFQDSGTIRRGMQAAVLGTAGTGAMFTGTAIPAAGAVAAGSALYTTPGQQLARALMAGQRPAAVAGAGKAAKAVSPYAATMAAMLASQPSY